VAQEVTQVQVVLVVLVHREVIHQLLARVHREQVVAVEVEEDLMRALT
jgi:hypothetical protein